MRQNTFSLYMVVFVLFCFVNKSIAFAAVKNNADSTQLPMSNMQVTVSSGDNVATFQLFNTLAAHQFYDQLPLSLELSNFRHAQWMFFPPQKLTVHPEESYHDGKKGELSYYEPWGDVFMLYKDFYAGDKMHRLGRVLKGIDNIQDMSGTILIEKHERN